MSDAANALSEWTQVELMGHRRASTQRVAGATIACAGVFGVVMGMLMAPQWWAVAGMLLGCGFVVLIGVSLWVQAGAAEQAATDLRATGRQVLLPVVAVTDTTDDMESFVLELALPVRGGRVVQHPCSDRRCIEAAHAFPGSGIPAMIDDSRAVWGIMHGSIDD